DATLGAHRLGAAGGVWLAQRRAVLPQEVRLAFPFTVHEVVRLGLLNAAEPEDALIPAALARVGLSGFEGRFYHELSGGEQQRAQLARVLVQVWEPIYDGAPRWLFLDEPVASLDLGHQLEVMDIARDYAEAGGGVIAVMHDLNLTALYAASVALMQSGRLVMQGPAEDVMTDARLSDAYGCRVRVSVAPDGAQPFILPHMAGR
ncbi:MAG: ATP-binding cassette domain-containing protein, partial [Pseudomonadota bacterium]